MIAQPLNPDFHMGKTLDKLQVGCTMARRGWKAGNVVKYHVPVKYSTLKTSTIYLYTNDAVVGVWQPKQVDLLADDWYEVTGETK